ncbi:hypothetical protein [Priestia filamentosa]|uniref:hypothetical protein n=1 Tax=Priestia filamentosa TaxID=1402861 RepID=UPI000A15B69C|nr:hypothetical protein [Priestia filamentosa]MDT3766438.1 hypothetical protein [Priestia filamentosa]OXS64036.1 hypothetical protein B1B01_25515 [Priestia filamentosa]
MGVGRIGGILGPTVGEFLLSSQLPLQLNFLAFAIPCSIGAIAKRQSESQMKVLIPESRQQIQKETHFKKEGDHFSINKQPSLFKNT